VSFTPLATSSPDEDLYVEVCKDVPMCLANPSLLYAEYLRDFITGPTLEVIKN
jgi:hypothetical protein